MIVLSLYRLLGLVIVSLPDSCSMTFVNLSELSDHVFSVDLFCSFFVKWLSLMLLLIFKGLLYVLDNRPLIDFLFANIFDQCKDETADFKFNEVQLINHFMDQAK